MTPPKAGDLDGQARPIPTHLMTTLKIIRITGLTVLSISGATYVIMLLCSKVFTSAMVFLVSINFTDISVYTMSYGTSIGVALVLLAWSLKPLPSDEDKSAAARITLRSFKVVLSTIVALVVFPITIAIGILTFLHF